MGDIQNAPLSQEETTCRSLLYELQIVWDEVGKAEMSWAKMLLELELEQECIEVYMRKVDVANHSRAQLQLAIDDSEAEFATIYSAIGELPLHVSCHLHIVIKTNLNDP